MPSFSLLLKTTVSLVFNSIIREDCRKKKEKKDCSKTNLAEEKL